MKRKSSLWIAMAVLTFLCTEVQGQLVADHSIVKQYDDIPQRWIDSVKTKLVWVIGMSHGNAYFRGAELLEQLDTTFKVDIWYHVDPPAEQKSALRLGRPRWGRESFWTSQDGIDNFNENTVSDQNETGNQYDYIGFGWSYQGVWENDLGGGVDPVYTVRWAGSTQAGPDGNKRWGLDSGDSILTENRVCMDTYLDAVEQYNQYYIDQDYETTFFFSNGIVDDDAGTEMGFQRELKNQHVRDYVDTRDDDTYFFDYADILVHNSAGELHTADWNDGDSLRPHQQLHPDNDMDYDEDFNIIAPGDDENEDHIGEVGALRLAKAMWWMLARISGWDGLIEVADIQVSSEADTSKVMTGDELQFSALVLPEEATNKAYVWSVINKSGTASISESGLLSGAHPGTVDVVALALDGSGAADTMSITITEALVPVTGIVVSTPGGVSQIDAGSTLQCLHTVMPSDASNPDVEWSVVNISGSAMISTDGLLSAFTEGSLDVIATAEDGSGMADTLQLSIVGSVILVSDIQIASAGGVNEILSGETLQYSATVLPVDAFNTSVSWSVINGSGTATISSGGLLTGGLPGEVEVVALAKDISGMGDTLGLTISDPLVPVTSITVSTAGGITEMDVGASLQCSSQVLPADASNTVVVWSVVFGTGSASISTGGLLEALTAGTVEVVARASDGSGVSHSLTITIISSAILISNLSIVSEGGVRAVDEGETLQFSALVLPENASNQSILWSVNQSTGSASIDQNGLLTAGTEGSVLIMASTKDGSGISSNFSLTINGPDGTLEQRKNSSIVLYPNPSPGKFYLDAGTLYVERVEVYSLLGTMVRELIPEPGEQIIEIDLSDQHSGAFFIQAFSNGKSYVHRIIISR